MDDPDAGDWTYAYDPVGNQARSTDATGTQLHTIYDELNRPTERRQTSTSGPVLASWDYDATGELGLLDSSTRDPADAVSAARTVQAGDANGTPKAATGSVEAIRLIGLARRSALKARTQAANQLHAVVTTAPDKLRTRLAGLTTTELVDRAARLRPGSPTTPAEAAKLTLVTLARRWQRLTDEITDLDRHLDQLTTTTAPSLIGLNGTGPQTAAALLTAAGDNPDRLRSEASFAALCGTSPLDASSGRQQRHRLNRGGDRHANAALYIIVISRLRWDPPTQAYMHKRLAQGKTRKEVIRCLKRYVARQIHRAITTDLAAPPRPALTA